MPKFFTSCDGCGFLTEMSNAEAAFRMVTITDIETKTELRTEIVLQLCHKCFEAFKLTTVKFSGTNPAGLHTSNTGYSK